MTMVLCIVVKLVLSCSVIFCVSANVCCVSCAVEGPLNQKPFYNPG